MVAEKIPLEELEEAPWGNGFLQSSFWARQKESFGWKTLAVRWLRKRPEAEEGSSETEGPLKGTLLILIRSFPGGLALAYVPGAPDPSIGMDDRGEFLEALSRELRGILPLGCFFIRYDLPEFTTGEDAVPSFPASLGRGGLKKAPLDIQPPHTVVLNLKEGYNSLLKGMHKKHRYNIGLAAKRGVTVENTGKEGLKIWYDLYRITAERDRIGIHPFAYYAKLFDLLGEPQNSEKTQGKRPFLRLYLARHEEDILAGIIVLFGKIEAVYLYGASSNKKRNLMPAYALQARAIQDACALSCSSYDLYGCPPSSEPAHPMAGLYRFKTGFGGELRHRPGAWDYPYSSLFYTLYRLVETLRRHYHKVWKKRKGN